MSAVARSGAQRASRHRMLGIASMMVLGALLTLAPTTAAADWSTSRSLSVESYYLRLLNCTRTGGWVRKDGSCKGYGSGQYSAYRPPLRLSSGISTYVARPYAKLLARRSACSHFLDGDPGKRLRRAGYTSYRWAENISCGGGRSEPYASVLSTHRYFQSEKSYGGGHWVNMKDPRYNMVGIGVWKYGSAVRLVVDFYHP